MVSATWHEKSTVVIVSTTRAGFDSVYSKKSTVGAYRYLQYGITLFHVIVFCVVKNQFCSLERLVWNITIATTIGNCQVRKIGLKKVALKTT